MYLSFIKSRILKPPATRRRIADLITIIHKNNLIERIVNNNNHLILHLLYNEMHAPATRNRAAPLALFDAFIFQRKNSNVLLMCC